MDANSRWYTERGCTHAHCPTNHDKPQPALVQCPDGVTRMLCMRCFCVDGVAVEVVPCTPETCDEAAPQGG